MRILWWVLFALCTLGYAYPYLGARIAYGTWDFETLEFLHWDRQFNFSIAQTFRAFGPNILDPFDRTYPVFYQQLLYWFFGAVAWLGGIYPWAAANILQTFFTPLLFVTLSSLARLLGLRGYPRLLALLLVFAAGPLSFWSQTTFGVHAVVLPLSHLLLGSYSDSYGVVLGAMGLLWLARLLDRLSRDTTTRERLVSAVAFGLLATSASLVQLLCFVQFMTLYGLVLVFWQWPPLETRVRRWASVFLGLAAAALIATRPHLLPMPIIFGVGALIFGTLLWRSRQRTPVIALGIAGVLVVAYLGLNLGAVKQSGLDPFLYQDTVRTIDLGIPWYVVLGALLPLIPGLLSLPLLAPDLGWRRAISWAIVVTAVLCCFNDAFGYNNHPYRFIPFGYPFLCLASAMGLQALGDWQLQKIRGPWVRPLITAGIAVLVALALHAQFLDLKQHLSHFARPLDPPRRDLITLLESLRTQDHPHPRVYVTPAVEYVEQLAPYTGVRFFKSSFLGYGQRIRTESLDQQNRLDALMAVIHEQKLPIDWVIIPRSDDTSSRIPPHAVASPAAWAVPVSTRSTAETQHAGRRPFPPG